MYKKAEPFFMICETPLHAGTGGELGVVDLPIQRERHTSFPKVEGSSLKGSIREAFENNCEKIDVGDAKGANQIEVYAPDIISQVFGPEEGDAHAGALGFTDARLLLFPVKSMRGVFAWITCPKVLNKFKGDMHLCEIILPFEVPEERTAPKDCGLFVIDENQALKKDNKIVLEEYTFEINKDSGNQDICTKLAKWFSLYLFPKLPAPQKDIYSYWRDKIAKDIVVLPDDDFKDFVNLSTEVITRTKINNETGTVQPGALFTEEFLPSESILYSLALTTPIFGDNGKNGIFKQNGKKGEDLVMTYFKKGLPPVIQLGGNATIGKGIVRTKTWEVCNEQ